MELLERQSDRYRRQASILFMTRDVAREKVTREKVKFIARDKRVLFKKIIDYKYKEIEYVFEVEEKLNQGRDNNLTAYIPSLRQLCLKMLSSNVTAVACPCIMRM